VKYYKKLMPQKDAPIRLAIQEAIGKTRRGRKKIIAMVRRKNPEIGSSKIRRIYQKEGFALYMKPTKRRKAIVSNPAYMPLSENVEWGIDFMHDSLSNGRSIRSLNIIDPYNRVCKGMFISYSIPATRLITFLERAVQEYGKPVAIRTDNGPEFISKRFQLWLKNQSIHWEQIKKGSPQENCFIERFNRTAREDFFNAELFSNIADTQQKADDFVFDYNSNRPHESLQNKTPLEYAA
jgi:putative transposase